MTTLEFKRKTSSGRFPWAMIDRDDAARRARLDPSSHDLLALDVDFGLYVVQQSLELRASTRPTLTAMAVSLLFHRAVELLDAVDVLLAAGSALPAHPIMLMMVETSIYARWLAHIDDDEVAAVYLLAAHHESLWRYENFHGGEAPPASERRERVPAFLRSLGGGSDWDMTLDEVARLHREGAPWFSAFNGPRSVLQLLRDLGDYGTIAMGFMMDEFGLTSRSLDWSESVNLDESPDPIAVSGLLHPLRDTRFYPDTGALVCHSAFVSALDSIVDYFGVELDGAAEWADAADEMMGEPEE